MLIRKAIPADAPVVAEYLFKAMEEITCNFVGRDKIAEIKRLLTQLAGRPANQYSYEFTWLAEEEGLIAGSATIYDGARLHELRRPVAKLVEATFHKEFLPEDETGPGEWYLDCIGVNSAMQGRGVGSRLLDFLIEKYVREQGGTIGLLVEKTNPDAKRLYLKKGFKMVGEKQFAGKLMEHLQIGTQTTHETEWRK